MNQLGGDALQLAQGELQLGRGETLRDTAMVLSRYLDAVMIRTFSQADIDELADLGARARSSTASRTITIRARRSPTSSRCGSASARISAGVRLAYVGDANNVCRSLVCAAVIAGSTSSLRRPRPTSSTRRRCSSRAEVTAAGGGSLTLTEDADEAARGAQALATDAFVSMGQEVETAERLDALMPGYRVDERRVRCSPTTASCCIACLRTTARRSTSRCSTGRARPSGIRPRTACTRRRRCWRHCSPARPEPSARLLTAARRRPSGLQRPGRSVGRRLLVGRTRGRRSPCARRGRARR